MKIQLAKIEKKEKDELKKMLLAYFKEIDKSKVIQTNNGEDIDYPFLELYWRERNRTAFNIRCSAEVVGFVLINNWTVCKELNTNKSIAEFYVKPKFRRKRIGEKAAYELFKNHKAIWEIRQSFTNSIAIKFWREIIKNYTNGIFKEIKIRKDGKVEVIQIFES